MCVSASTTQASPGWIEPIDPAQSLLSTLGACSKAFYVRFDADLAKAESFQRVGKVLALPEAQGEWRAFAEKCCDSTDLILEEIHELLMVGREDASRHPGLMVALIFRLAIPARV
jgi:hypothetical protein